MFWNVRIGSKVLKRIEKLQSSSEKTVSKLIPNFRYQMLKSIRFDRGKSANGKAVHYVYALLSLSCWLTTFWTIYSALDIPHLMQCV